MSQRSLDECRENVPAKKSRRRRTRSDDSTNSSSDGESCLSDDSCDKDDDALFDYTKVHDQNNEIALKSDVLTGSTLRPTLIADSNKIVNNAKINSESKSVTTTNLSPNSTYFDSNKAPAPTLALPLSNTKHNSNNNTTNHHHNISYKSFGDCFMTQFSRSCVGSSKYLMNAHLNVVSDDDLVFESRFESGNLAKAIKITPVYYELYLRPDLYTNKHTQWFYFRVTNVKKGLTYR